MWYRLCSQAVEGQGSYIVVWQASDSCYTREKAFSIKMLPVIILEICTSFLELQLDGKWWEKIKMLVYCSRFFLLLVTRGEIDLANYEPVCKQKTERNKTRLMEYSVLLIKISTDPKISRYIFSEEGVFFGHKTSVSSHWRVINNDLSKSRFYRA